MKGSSIKAAWQGKCPGCEKGDIFEYPFSRISKFSAMNDRCANCGVSFMPEPGFYFGALYVSYSFTIAFFVGLWLILYLLFDPADWVYGVAIVLACILFVPFSFRYSRILFLYWFGGIKRI
jgi:uncharacterized protein (DUF983 family)